MTPKWSDAEIVRENDRSYFVRFAFDNLKDAKEFLKHAEISKDVDMELLNYGEGVLRTLKKGQHGRTGRAKM